MRPFGLEIRLVAVRRWRPKCLLHGLAGQSKACGSSVIAFVMERGQVTQVTGKRILVVKPPKSHTVLVTN